MDEIVSVDDVADDLMTGDDSLKLSTTSLTDWAS